MPPEASPTDSWSTISLEFGADSAAFNEGDLDLDPHGITLRSPWRFNIGTCLQIKVLLGDGPSPDIIAEGIVVDCHPDRPGRYQLTLIFQDPPRELGDAMRRLSQGRC